MTYSGRLEDRYTGLGGKTLVAKWNFFFFQLYYNKNYVEVAINDFTMPLKNADRRENNETKRSKRKKKLSMKVFSFISYVIDQASISFFLLRK